MQERVCAVVVLFNPDMDRILGSLAVIYDQVDWLVLVDNSAMPLNNEVFNIFSENNWNSILYLHNKNIGGIAGGHNCGIKYAIDNEFDFVILFDQDSKPDFDLLSGLKHDFKRLIDKGFQPAAIGPEPINKQNNKAYKPRLQKKYFFDGLSEIYEEKQLISSGTLFPVNVFEIVGLMEEELFIDGVDHEWCWRARALGFVIAMSGSTKMYHMLGEGDHNFLGLKIAITSPSRLYYQYRNYFSLLFRGYVPFYWKLNNGIKYVIKIFYYGLFVKPQGHNLKLIFKGIKEGVKFLKSN